MAQPSFTVVGGVQVAALLSGRHAEVIDVVRAAYLAHGNGETVNPPSYFLRFPDRPHDRIIALPAALGAEFSVNGIKWISSYPGNRTTGIPRASAVLILNDPETGYPFACLESSIISATRTAASAVLVAGVLATLRGRAPRRLGILGTGLIARYVHDHLRACGQDFEELHLHDEEPAYAAAFRAMTAESGDPVKTFVHDDPEELIRSSDLVVIATTAGAPHITRPDWFAHHPIVLNISLRDLSPEVILASWNVVDDIDHCLTANTSPHLAAQVTGDRTFIAGAACDLLTGRLPVPAEQTVIFSPFGLGVLDLAVGHFVFTEGMRRGLLSAEPDFFHDLDRYSTRQVRTASDDGSTEREQQC